MNLSRQDPREPKAGLSEKYDDEAAPYYDA